MARRLICGVLLALIAGRALADAAAEPQRIVSMNLCLDSILVELVPREHILALSQYSRDPWRSTIADVAAKLPYTNETAEEVVALQPDLVLASRHSAIATRNALKRVGVRFELFGVPQSIEDSVEQIRRLASLLHRQREGEALIARIQDAIQHSRPAPGERVLSAAIYQPGGLTTGANTVVGELMRIAGLENVAARYGVTSYRPLSLELLVSQPPDVLLVGDTTYGSPSHAERLVHHRALRALQSRMSRGAISGSPALLLRPGDDRCAGCARRRTQAHQPDAADAERAMTPRSTRPLFLGLILLVIVLMAASLLVGKVTLNWHVLSQQDPITRLIFVELRLPRALLGALIGAALGLAGAAMQSYLRNPLAEPGTLGVSSMAALGAVLSIFFGIAGAHPWTLPLCGVAGGMAAMTALFMLAGRSASMLTLVLSGIVLSALAVAGISLVLSLSPSPWAASEIIRWMLGALTDRSFDDLTIATP